MGLGVFSLKGWRGHTLLVASISHFIGLPDSRIELLPSSGEQLFSWDVRADTVTPVSEALRHPVRYFCAGLQAPDSLTRGSAADALRRLHDRSAIPCVEAALVKFPQDDDLQEVLRVLRSRPIG